MYSNLRTILYREGGKWLPSEVGKIVRGLKTIASGHPEYPEYVILMGHHTKEATLEALDGGLAYTATQVTGSDQLPFKPLFV